MKTENIKFRGKFKKTGEWLYGDLIRNVEGAFAIVPPYEISMNNYYRNYVVDKETIGQFTGLCDESGKAVYEGDLLRGYDNNVIEVVWSDACFCGCISNTIVSLRILDVEDRDVIGNIYDNKELLERVKK